MQKTTNARDLFFTQQENKKTYPQIDARPKAIKGILIGALISIALWCIIFSLAIVIF